MRTKTNYSMMNRSDFNRNMWLDKPGDATATILGK